MSTSFSSTQTEPEDQDQEQLHRQNPKELDKPALKDFLHRVVETTIQELVKNTRSHAFDGFEVNWEDHNELVGKS